MFGPKLATGWSICLLLLIATMLNYMDRQALVVTYPTLKADYHLTESRVGMLEGCFGFAFAFGSIFFGLLADRYGPRLLYPLVLIGWSVAGMATGMAGQRWVTDLLQTADSPPGQGVYYWLLICRTVLGACEAGHWPCALLTIRAMLSPADRTLGNGILQSGASIGAITVPLYIELTDRMGYSWEFPFWSIGILGLFWVPLWFYMIGNHPLHPSGPELALPQTIPEEAADTEFAMREAQRSRWALIRRILALSVVIASLVFSWQFMRAWLALYLEDYHGYSKLMTRGFVAGYYIAADAGCLLAGGVVAWLMRRGWSAEGSRRLGYTVFAIATAAVAFVPLLGNGWLMIAAVYLGAAGILGLHPYYYALTQEISTKQMGLIFGFLAAFGWIISSLSQIYLGRLIEATQSYQTGLILVGIAPLIGLLALLLLWPAAEPKTS